MFSALRSSTFSPPKTTCNFSETLKMPVVNESLKKIILASEFCTWSNEMIETVFVGSEVRGRGCICWSRDCKRIVALKELKIQWRGKVHIHKLEDVVKYMFKRAVVKLKEFSWYSEERENSCELYGGENHHFEYPNWPLGLICYFGIQ